MRRGASVRAIVGLTLAALALGGCTQVEAIAPVGGALEAAVRFATNDILVKEDVDILVAPVCTQTANVVDCTGEAVRGAAITSHSEGAKGEDFTVMVGDDTIFTGSVQDVLNEESQP